MTMLKILSAALIATTMLTTAASAYENPMHKRHAVEHAHPGSILPFADEFDRHPWMSGPPPSTPIPRRLRNSRAASVTMATIRRYAEELVARCAIDPACVQGR